MDKYPFSQQQAVDIFMTRKDTIDKPTAEARVKDMYDMLACTVDILTSHHPTLTIDDALVLALVFTDPEYDAETSAETKICATAASSRIGVYYRTNLKILARKHPTLKMADWFAIMEYNYRAVGTIAL